MKCGFYFTKSNLMTKLLSIRTSLWNSCERSTNNLDLTISSETSRNMTTSISKLQSGQSIEWIVRMFYFSLAWHDLR